MREVNHAKYLKTLRSVRERCAILLRNPAHLRHFDLRLGNIDRVVDNIIMMIKRDYDSHVGDIPFHARWRHCNTNNVGRMESLIEKWMIQNVDAQERCRRLIDLLVVSVLVDAGAGPDWKYVPLSSEDKPGACYSRSEGLAVAALEMFDAGKFSSNKDNPWQVDAAGLERLSEEEFNDGFQIKGSNFLLGSQGRFELLKRLGVMISKHTKYFGSTSPPRPGNLLDFIISHPRTSETPQGWRTHLDVLWEVIIEAFSEVWPPGRTTLGGVSLGDCWPSVALRCIQLEFHPTLEVSDCNAQGLDLIPFHKLSQWLTYSLLEPLWLLGVEMEGTDDLTGLAEYRNGGLFVDMSVIELRRESLSGSKRRHGSMTNLFSASYRPPLYPPSSDVVVEWRALTVALIDLVAQGVRERLGLKPHELPLGKILEAGTWKAGREVAAKLRPETKGPPIEIESDGTVF